MKLYNFLFITGIAISALTSCASDETSDNGNAAATGAVTLNISSASFGTSSTRSVTDEGTSDGTSEEWMKTWALVIIDNASKKIEKIINRPVTTNMVKSETYQIDLTQGDKTVFAFANITASEAGITYTEGSTLTDTELADIKTHTSAMTDGNGFTITEPTKYLPMSNIVYTTITNKQQQSVDIPLYRMISKLQFDFTSDASKDITVSSVIMGPMTTAYIYTWPVNVQFSGDRTDYAYAPLFPATTVSGDYTYTWSSGNVITAGNTTPVSKSFYVNESKASTYSKHLVFTLHTVRDGKAEEENYSLTDLAYINRNDFVKIPVVLTDYIFTPKATFYPPIGGYPAVTVTNTDDKSYFVFNNAGGDFVINPNIRKANDLSLAEAKNVQVHIDTNPSLFTTIPTYSAIDGTIVGELGTTAGTSEITLTIDIKTGVSGLTRTLTRKIYIVVQ